MNEYLEYIKELMMSTSGIPKDYIGKCVDNKWDVVKSDKRFEEMIDDVQMKLSKQATAACKNMILTNLIRYQYYIIRHISIRKFKKYAKKHKIINYGEIIRAIKGGISKSQKYAGEFNKETISFITINKNRVGCLNKSYRK